VQRARGAVEHRAGHGAAPAHAAQISANATTNTTRRPSANRFWEVAAGDEAQGATLHHQVHDAVAHAHKEPEAPAAAAESAESTAVLV